MNRTTLDKVYCWPSPKRGRSHDLWKFPYPPTSLSTEEIPCGSVISTCSESVGEHTDCYREHHFGSSNTSPDGKISTTAKLHGEPQAAAPRVTGKEVATITSQQRNRNGKMNKSAVAGSKEKKHASGRGQLYEYSRLGQVREGANGRIYYKIHWKPTWGILDDLQGDMALEEAKELTIKEFDQDTWDGEVYRSGHYNLNAETN